MEIEKHLITKHFTATPTRKTHIVLHWSTTKTLEQIYNTFMGARKASAHYGIGEDGTIWQFVEDKYIAWHASEANTFAIGIEHCGGYPISSGQRARPTVACQRAKPTVACMDASAELVKYLSTKYGIPVTNEFIKPHNFYDATACPGSLDINYIISQAKIMDDYKEKLAKAIEWNNEIKVKGLTLEQVDFKSANYAPSKLLNVVDNKEREELLIRLKDLTDWLQSTQSLKNTKELDLILRRYAYYAQNSTSV